jgi:hypothetical protein
MKISKLPQSFLELGLQEIQVYYQAHNYKFFGFASNQTSKPWVCTGIRMCFG